MSGRLLVPRKSDNTPAGLTESFRAIERWATLTWTDATLKTGWANVAGGLQVARYLLDPFGFTIIEGWVSYTGSVASGVETPILQVPAVGANNLAPPLIVTFPPGGNPDPRIDVKPDGTVNYLQFTGSAQTNPAATLSGIRFATFN